MKHKHDWKQTGTAFIPTGKYAFMMSYNGGEEYPVHPITFEALIHICLICDTVKATRLNSLSKTGDK